MSERIVRRSAGLSAGGLRAWGLILLTLGIGGRSIIQNSILHMNTIGNAELFEALQSNSALMGYATVALVLQAMETCAAPIFAMLLVEGVLHTADLKKYLLRVLGCALLSEIPYNMAYSGKYLDLAGRNPVFALVLGIVMLYFFRRYAGKDLKNIGIKFMVFAAAFVWSRMLNIADGQCIVILVAVLWFFREKKTMRSLFGFSASMLCSMFNVYYVASTMSFILIHIYNEEKGERNAVLNYLCYPLVLLCAGVAGMYLV